MTQIALPAQGNGLLLDVQIGLTALRREQLWKRSMTAPPAVAATLIIDTGADTTMINDQIARTLGLTPTGQTRVLTSGSKGVPETCDVYDIELTIINRKGGPAWVLQPLEVLARPLPNQATDGMLGRDVLALCLLTYDGPRKLFTIDYPTSTAAADD